jgi:hypothetical protein
MKRATALVEKTGGRVEGDRVTVRLQDPKPGKLELWDDYGSPVERVRVDDQRWSFAGDWKTPPVSGDRRPRPSKMSSAKAAEASVSFDGTGAIVTGSYMPAGGTADVYLDGKLDRTVDVYPDENSTKTGEAVWHAFGLKNGKHTVKLVVRGEPYPGSTGSEISLDDIIVFR